VLRPVPMGKLRVLILKRYVAEVTAALGEFGGVHLVDASESGLTELDARAEISQFDALLARSDALMGRIGVADEVPPAAVPTRSHQELVAFFSEVEKELESAEQGLEDLVRESGLLARRAARLRRLPTEDIPLATIRSLGHLYLVTGRIAPSLVPVAQATLGERGVLLHDATVVDRRDQVMVVTTRRSRWAVESDLQELGFEREDLPEDVDGSANEAKSQAEGRLEQLRLEILACQTAGRRLALAHGPQLKAARGQLVRSLAVARAQCHFGSSEHLVCIAGWVPRSLEGDVRGLVERTTAGTGIVEIRPADDDPEHGEVDSIPVQLAPNRLLRPFQILVSNFGSPRYGDVDPSLFVGITFVLMFGIMFGDVGQGAVIALLGAYFRWTRRPSLRGIRDAGVLLMVCGGCAVVFGFLYGSVFGNEELLPALWLSPMHDVSTLLGAAVVLGIIFISVAILINIVNKVRSRHYFESVFDKFGVIGIIFYWGALGIGLKAARAGALDSAHIVLLIVVPLTLLFIREPLHNLLRHRKMLHSDPFSFLLEACIETLETVTAFLGSTVSFVRVGAFALSHAALCLAIFSVADIMKSLPAGGIWAGVVIVFGNLLVITMEGMVAMIQGVRLEYYELFGKYFAGDGLPYHPFELQQPDGSNPNNPGESES
jgi:V/A-type H+/Na+-transporting ATPase subunit I